MPTPDTDSASRASEPFRAFFPLGVAASILGVLVWPLFYAGWWQVVPQLLHPRLMIFGFGGAFVAGFLGTAWPRFVEAGAMKSWELGGLILSWSLAQFAYLFAQWRFGDAAFAAHSLCLLAFLADRARRGDDRPNGAFLMAAGGVGLGFITALIWTASYFDLPPLTHLLTRLFAFQGMLLLPLLGLGPFMFPRFFDKLIPAPRAGRGLALAAILVLVSFLIEASGWVRCGNLLRFSGIAVWAILACPTIWRAKVLSTRSRALRLALGLLATSFLTRSIWPGPGYAIEHLLFLGGFGLAILLIAERVSLGHSDRLPPIDETSTRWRWLVWLLIITAATRISADLKASLLISHHIYAALIWSGILIAWALPLVRRWMEKPEA